MEVTQVEQGFKVLVTITGASCIAYFSGPYAAILAREAFSLGYGYLYDLPRFFSVENFTVYSPMREHVGHMAYTYGAGTLALASMPLLYKSWDLLKWCVTPKALTAAPQPTADNEAFVNKLSEILDKPRDEVQSILDASVSFCPVQSMAMQAQQPQLEACVPAQPKPKPKLTAKP